MGDGERAKRPVLERSEPIRSWSGLVGASERPGGGTEPRVADAGARVDDVIVRSVELGYRVIDDYIKRGQVAAERLQHGAYGAGDLARDAQGVAGQMVRSAADLAGAWVEFLALAGRNGNGHANGPPMDAGVTEAPVPAPPDAAPVAMTPDAAPPRATPPAVLRVRLAVAASRPVETALELQPVPAEHGLVVHALRAAGAARIDDVRVERVDDTAVIRVRVGAEQAAGTYTGLVVDDATNLPVGALTVVLAAE